VSLGRPERIESDVRICFHGSGQARFRLEHGRDGKIWYPVIQPPTDREAEVSFWSADADPTVPVDWVDGEYEVIYRRHKADWLQVVAADADEETQRRCETYEISFEPIA
jgi:hypothetical protein